MDIAVLDMRKIANFCDYFVLCSGNTDRQVKAIAEGIEEGLAGLGLHTPPIQGKRDSGWVLLDLGDIVVHVLEKEKREFYGLEYLWQTAKKINWEK